MTEYHLKHETTEEFVQIKAVSVDSETHKYCWTFWRFDFSGETKLIKCVYSQRYSIVEIIYPS